MFTNIYKYSYLTGASLFVNSYAVKKKVYLLHIPADHSIPNIPWIQASNHICFHKISLEKDGKY